MWRVLGFFSDNEPSISATLIGQKHLRRCGTAQPQRVSAGSFASHREALRCAGLDEHHGTKNANLYFSSFPEAPQHVTMKTSSSFSFVVLISETFRLCITARRRLLFVLM